MPLELHHKTGREKKPSLPTWKDRYKPSVTSTQYVLVTNVDRQQRDAHCAHEIATTDLHLFAIFANFFLRLLELVRAVVDSSVLKRERRRIGEFCVCLFVLFVCACVRDSTRRSDEIPLIENRYVATSSAASEGGRRVEWSWTAQHCATS